MRTLGQAFFLQSEFGIVHDLPHAGSALEHPLVFHDAAHEIKHFAERGLAEIVSELHANTVHGPLISELKYKRIDPRELRAEL